MSRTFSELIKLNTLNERYHYLRIPGIIGESTFGFDRYLNQKLYNSTEWRRVRDLVIVRDNGCDLGIEDFPIQYGLVIHHMNPITIDDIRNREEHIFDPEFLITTSSNTHLAIHFSNESLLPKVYVPRSPGDTTLWSRKGVSHGKV